MTDLTKIPTGRGLIAEFLLRHPDLWDRCDFDTDGDPRVPLSVAHAFADWMHAEGVIDRERCEREKRIFGACAKGS